MIFGIKALSEIITDNEVFNKAYKEAQQKGLSQKEAIKYAKIQVAINQKIREKLNKIIRRKNNEKI